MVQHEAVVSVVHLQQCRPCKFVSIAVFYKPATSEPQTIARICEADDALLRGEGFQPYLQARCIAKWLPQFKQSDLLGMEARDMQDTDVHRSLAFARENLDLFPVLVRETHGHDNMFRGDHRGWREEPRGTSYTAQTGGCVPLVVIEVPRNAYR